MAQAELLAPGDPFPPLSLPAVSGDEIQLPEAAEGHWAAVLFYRGHW